MRQFDIVWESGRQTTSGGNAALVIIDGVPAGPTGIERVAPYDVAQITILKDAGSTAIYGSRGANGVVIIRTKRASDR